MEQKWESLKSKSESTIKKIGIDLTNIIQNEWTNELINGKRQRKRERKRENYEWIKFKVKSKIEKFFKRIN